MSRMINSVVSSHNINSIQPEGLQDAVVQEHNIGQMGLCDIHPIRKTMLTEQCVDLILDPVWDGTSIPYCAADCKGQEGKASANHQSFSSLPF